MARARAKYRLEADDRTASGLRSAEGRLARFGRTVRSRLGVAIAGIGTAIAGWGREISESTNRLDDLAKSAKDLGTSLEEAQALQLGAELQGTGLEKVLSVIERLSQATLQAQRGSKEYQELFAALNLEASQFARLNPAAQIVTLARAFNQLPAAEARQRRQALVGEGTGRLFAGDVEASFRRAGELGLLDNLPELATQAERTKDALAELAAVVNRRRDEIFGGEVAEAILRAATRFATGESLNQLRGIQTDRFSESDRRIWRAIEFNTRDRGARYGPG